MIKQHFDNVYLCFLYACWTHPTLNDHHIECSRHHQQPILYARWMHDFNVHGRVPIRVVFFTYSDYLKRCELKVILWTCDMTILPLIDLENEEHVQKDHYESAAAVVDGIDDVCFSELYIVYTCSWCTLGHELICVLHVPATFPKFTLPETNSSHLKNGSRAPKGNDLLSTIHFQVL